MNLERTVTIVVVAGLAVALSASEIARLMDRRILNEKLVETEQTAQSALEAVIAPAVLRDADHSVYMVTVNDKHAGSAFVIDRERGILGTAAHVATELDFTKPDQTHFVINRHSGKPLRIRTARIHSGYGAFRKLAENYQPVDPSARITSPKPMHIYDLPHDGALLFIDPIDPETGANILGPALPIASDETLGALNPGDPIAIIGFPVDTITDNIHEESAASRVERGVIANMINPIDLVENSADPETKLLIIHRMAMAPGNSGGPVLNGAGEVVGINSHGNASSYSNGDSVAQRADILHELLSPFREQDMLERVFFPAWKERLGKWPSARDALPAALYERHRNRSGLANLNEISIGDVEIEEKPPYEVRLIDVDFNGFQADYVFVAKDLITGEPAAANGAEENDDPNVRTAGLSPTFQIEKRGHYRIAREKFSPRRAYAVFAFDYTLDWSRRGSCGIELFYRKKGDPELRATGARPVASFFIPAGELSDPPQEYNVIIRGDYCDQQSDRFLYGVVSWVPKIEDPIPPVAMLESAREEIVKASARAANAIDCHAPAIGDRDACAKPVKIRNFTPSKN